MKDSGEQDIVCAVLLPKSQYPALIQGSFYVHDYNTWFEISLSVGVILSTVWKQHHITILKRNHRQQQTITNNWQGQITNFITPIVIKGTIISSHLLHTAKKKKKSIDYPHWWITCMLYYSTFWWQKRDINVVQFSLLIVVWSNFQKLEHFFVEFKVKEIQTCAQFCVNISMYFIAKIMQ